METGNKLTDAQRAALAKVWELLLEHFDSAILAYDTEMPEGTDRTFDCNYHGGLPRAIGLCECAKLTFKKQFEGSEED